MTGLDRAAARDKIKPWLIYEAREHDVEQLLDALEACVQPQFIDREALTDLILWAMHAGLRTDTSEVWVDRFLSFFQRQPEDLVVERVKSPMMKCWVSPVGFNSAESQPQGVNREALTELILWAMHDGLRTDTVDVWVDRFLGMLGLDLTYRLVAADILDHIAIELGRQRIVLPNDVLNVLDHTRHKFVDEQ